MSGSPGTAEPLPGRCSCGQVHYRLVNEPLFVQACHCLDCQRTTGSAFVVHIVAVEHDFEIEGDTECTVVPTGSGAGCELHYCTTCAVYVWVRYRYHQVPVIAIRAGTLDDPLSVQPEVHIFTRSKQPWIKLAADAHCFETGCTREEAWSKSSIARYNALAKT